MACTLASRVLGFVRSAIIGALFGGDGPADVLNFVFSIPNNLRKLLAEGAFSAAFIPALSTTMVEDPSGGRARELSRRILTFQIVVLVPVVAASILLARPIVLTLARFPSPDKAEQAVRLFRWLFGYLLFVSIASVLVAVLNAHSRFIVPALSPLVFSVAVIASLLLLHRRLGIFAMAVGVLAGGAGQVLFQLPLYRRLGYDARPRVGFRHDRDFRSVIAQWVPVIGASAVFVALQQLAMVFASGLENGSTSALSYAIVFWQLPFGIFSASVATVLFPRLSRQAALGEYQTMGRTVAYGLRFLLILLIPSTLVLVMLPHELVSAALQRGAFSQSNTQMTAGVLRCYAYGLVFVGCYTFLQRVFYSLHDTKTPLLSAAVVAVVDVALSLWLKETVLRVRGLAVANTVAFGCGLIVLFVAILRRLRSMKVSEVLRGVLHGALGALPVALVCGMFLWLWPQGWMDGSEIGFVVALLGACAMAAAGTIGVYLLLGVDVLRDILRSRDACE